MGGDANIALEGQQASQPGPRGQARGLLEATKLLSGYEPYVFPCAYLPSELQRRLGKQIVGRQARHVECSPLMLLTYTLAAYPLYVASEFPVWDLETPWDFDRSRPLFKDTVVSPVYNHRTHKSATPASCMDGDPYLRILDAFLDAILEKSEVHEAEDVAWALSAFWLRKPVAAPVLQLDGIVNDGVATSDDCLEVKCRDVLASPCRRHLQAVLMLVRKVVNLQRPRGPNVLAAESNARDLLLTSLLPPLYSFLRWSFASLHWKINKGEYLLQTVVDKMSKEGNMEAQYIISAKEALYRTIDIWESVLTPVPPLEMPDHKVDEWRDDHVYKTALFHTVVTYDVMRTLRTMMQIEQKMTGASRPIVTKGCDARWLIEIVDRFFDLPPSTLSGKLGLGLEQVWQGVWQRLRFWEGNSCWIYQGR